MFTRLLTNSFNLLKKTTAKVVRFAVDNRVTHFILDSRLVRYLVGEIPKALQNRALFFLKIIEEADKHPYNVSIKNLGKIGGNEVDIFRHENNANQAFIARLLTKLDEEQNNSRRPYISFSIVVNPENLLFNTNQEAAQYRKKLIPHLLPTRYPELTSECLKDAIKKGGKFIIQDFVFSVVRNILARGMLGVNNLPDNANELLNQVSAKTIDQKGLLNLFPGITSIPGVTTLLGFKETSRNYHNFVKKLLRDHIATLKDARPGWLTDELKLRLGDLPVTEEKIQELLQDPYLLQMPFILLGANNLAHAIVYGLTRLSNKDLHYNVINYTLECALLGNNNDAYVEAFYEETLLQAPTMTKSIARYAEKEIEIKVKGASVTIPKQSTILVHLDPTSKNQLQPEFDPARHLPKNSESKSTQPKEAKNNKRASVLLFSEGQHKCPAMRTSKAIFQSFFGAFYQQQQYYDLSFTDPDKEGFATGIDIKASRT